MKRVISIILCLTMLFVMAAVPALAENSGGKWVEILNEDFTNRSVNEPFAVDKSAAITYPDASAYIYYTGSNSQNVTYTVGEYESEKALKISRQGSKGDRRLFFEFNNYLSGQIEISFRMLASAIINEVVNVEVYDSPDVDTQKVITGTKIGVVSTGTRFYTHYYNSSSKTNDVKDEDLWLTANTWVDVKYSINTANGDVTAKYTYNGYTVTREIAGTAALPAVAGICFRLKNTTDTLDFYVDDIVVKHYEEPSVAETEFDFNDFCGENVKEAEVTETLALNSQFTDSEKKVWNVTWSSSDNSVVNSQTGAVNRGNDDKVVTITATLTNGTKTFTKEFTLIVPAFLKEFDFSDISSESINGVTSSLNLIDEFTDDDGRVWKITWSSANNDLIDSETGTVTAGGIDERVMLTASLTYFGDSTESEIPFSRSFNVKVLAAGTYHLRDGFNGTGNYDYTKPNTIKDYKGDGSVTWGVGSNYGQTDKAGYSEMSADVSSDPENPQDKVLKLHRTASGTTQRVWTSINSDASQLNDMVYVGMRVLREKNGAPTDIYANATDGTRLMRVEFATDNTITYYYGDEIKDHNTSTIKAPSGKWFDITIELDIKNGCYNVYIDGQSIVQDTLATGEKGIGFGGLTFDVNRNYSDEATIYFDDITVRTEAGLPYSIVEYNFTDAQGYPTHSMVEGGYLESVKMRKLRSVDAGTEPTLYVCFFKDNLLYDVVSAPIDENGSVGGFNVTLNKALPENVLDYEVNAFVFSKALVPLMNLSSYVPYTVNPTIFVAGDSLAAQRSAKEYPLSGYVQQLENCFEEGTVNIENHAEGGRSSKSFISEGRLATILEKACSGDYLFIQFGHNDAPGKGEERETSADPDLEETDDTSFKYYLMQYINGAKARGVVPVLITPPARNSFVDGMLEDKTLLKHVEIMRTLARDKDVLLIDLYAGWKDFVDNRPVVNGVRIDSTNFYSTYYPNDERFINDSAWEGSDAANAAKYDDVYKWYVVNPDNATDKTKHVHYDGTHLNVYGAKVAAKIIADALATSGLDLAKNILEDREAVCPWGDNYATFGEIEAR